MDQVDTAPFLGATLDTQLTWKPSLKALEARAITQLSLMKKPAGTRWGANAKILSQVNTCAVRPVAPIREMENTVYVEPLETRR